MSDTCSSGSSVWWLKRSLWRLEGSTWHDPISSRRLNSCCPGLSRQPNSVDDEACWVSEKVDDEAVEVGCLMLEMLAPAGPQGRDRDALAILLALTALNDSYSVSTHYADIFEKSFQGRTINDWIGRASRDADTWSAREVAIALRTQVDALSAQRRERQPMRDTPFPVAEEQVRRNESDYREYLMWRCAEGCYFGVLLMAAMAAGIDLRAIPWHRIRDTLEAGVVGFDLHGSLRHHSEDETGNVLAYLPGVHRQRITTGLRVVTRLHRLTAHAADLTRGQKEFLLRYMTSASLINYMPSRWSRTTPLHLQPSTRHRRLVPCHRRAPQCRTPE